MHFNLIGAGRLGKNLAAALVNSGQATLAGVCSRTFAGATQAVRELGYGSAVPVLADLPAVDLTFIVTPDDLIAQIANELAQHQSLSLGSTVVHCSGALGSEVLLPLQKQGCHIAGFHPVKAFREGNLFVNGFEDCDCVIEGDPAALALISPLFQQLGATLVSIHPDKKALYHAAAVMAANYLVTLAATSADLLTKAGMDTLQAKAFILRLMQSSLDNMQQTNSFDEALTGPLARGDVLTLKNHLQALETPEIKALYQSAALLTLPLTHLDNEKALIIKQLMGQREK